MGKDLCEKMEKFVVNLLSLVSVKIIIAFLRSSIVGESGVLFAESRAIIDELVGGSQESQ